jgi:hypothetical protein
MAQRQLARLEEFRGCAGITGSIRACARQSLAEARRHTCTCGLDVEEPQGT